ncbi:MAG: hypothetical protein JSW27_04670 [Phycisphaerales bacterium]|nr:MAG: hypothetical protein JSW27_04670 [Phycisphaerales bacterium]
MSERRRIRRAALLVAAVVCGGAMATAVGVRIHRYYFEGRDADGVYHFGTEPETIYEKTYENADGIVRSVSVTRGGGISISSDPDDTMDVEQTRKDLEETALLRQQGARELMRVIDTQVNGHPHRTCSYRYILSDGRERTIGESDPDRKDRRTLAQTEQDMEEIEALRRKGERELVHVWETEVEGRIHRTLGWQYVLADGHKRTVGEGDPEPEMQQPVLSDGQRDEMFRLRRLKQGEFLGHEDREIYGKVFTFEVQQYTLAGGIVVTYSAGEPAEAVKIRLTEADWEEFRRLRDAGAGVDLGAYEEEVQGRRFLFKPQQFILSDGTEFIWAVGTPRTN